MAHGRVAVNEFVVLLQNAAGAGWVFLVAIGATAVGFLIFDREKKTHVAQGEQSARERRAA